jgi:SAM-dependent methyltransferase
MIEEFDCPVCGSDAWATGRTYRYSRGGSGSPRQRVLFEVWFPDHDRVSLTLTWCRRCGFVCYSPRPTALDIDRKYAFTNSPGFTPTHDDDGGLDGSPADDGHAGFSQLRAHDDTRARRLYRQLSPHLGRRGSLLDVGGGHGQLLAPFREAGWSCFVVDYTEQVLPGVERIGSTLGDLAESDRFDGAILSHVLEHLAEPTALLTELRAHLRPDAPVFAEVPLEVWRGIPIHRDPVTHINFFTPTSFFNLFSMNGWEVLDAQCRRFPGERQVVGVIVARPSHASPRLSRGGERETRALLQPGRLARVQHGTRSRGGVQATATRAVRRALRGIMRA